MLLECIYKYSLFVFCLYSSYKYFCAEVVSLIMLLRYHPNLVSVLFGFDIPTCSFIFKKHYILLFYIYLILPKLHVGNKDLSAGHMMFVSDCYLIKQYMMM